MTTPKEALEQIANVETSLDKTILLCQIATMKRVAAEALASLQGEDAVERVARIIDPTSYQKYDDAYASGDWHVQMLFISAVEVARTKARAILATGLVAQEAIQREYERGYNDGVEWQTVHGEAAIRADEREKQRERDAEIADCIGDKYDATSFMSPNAEQVAALRSKEQAAHEIAAAIRSGGGE